MASLKKCVMVVYDVEMTDRCEMQIYEAVQRDECDHLSPCHRIEMTCEEAHTFINTSICFCAQPRAIRSDFNPSHLTLPT